MSNQTEDDWLAGVAPEAMGTGIFILPESEYLALGQSDRVREFYTDNRLLIKALVRDISYPKCIARGEQPFVLDFKWVPESLASYSLVQSQAANCGTVLCARRCARYGCVCVQGLCE